ncbi:unnamed protein product [Sphagnum balticum]
MPGISIYDLFFSPQQPRQKSAGSCSSQHALISGPPNCGKTSLLLQFAYNHAMNKDSIVTFICKQHAFDVKPPFLSQGVQPDSDVFTRITIKYVHDYEELLKYFAAFHVQSELPRAVIIDDFYDLFDERKCHERFGHMRARETAMVKTLALAHDAIIYANESLGPQYECKLLVSDTHTGDGPRLQYIYQRWLHQIFTIRSLDNSRFSVSGGKVLQKGTHDDSRAIYSLVQNTLVLEQFDCH